MNKNKITYGKNVYGKDEINAVVKTLKSTTQMGKNVQKFENQISKLLKKKYSLMVNSGSSALLLALKSLNLPRNSNVITPALTFGTTISSIVHSGYTPNLIDVKIDTLCIDEKLIEKIINSKTKAMLIPNLIGLIPNWPFLRKICKKYNLILIEDCADTLDSRYLNKPTSLFSDITISSFYGSHIINCAGNGGALAINDETVLRKAKLLRSWGRSSSLFDEKSEAIENRFNVDLDGYDYDAKFVFETVGYNLEGNELGAAFGLVQLEKLQKNIDTRQANFQRQCEFFDKHSKYFSNPQETYGCDTAWLAFPILIKKDAPFTRKEFQIFLEKKNIQTRVVFTGNILRQPMCKNIVKKVLNEGYPNADSVMARGVLLPLHHGLTETMFSRFQATVDEFVARYDLVYK